MTVKTLTRAQIERLRDEHPGTILEIDCMTALSSRTGLEQEVAMRRVIAAWNRLHGDRT